MHESAVMLDQGTQLRPRGAIEFLARECQVSVETVTQLYDKEWRELAVNARLTGFLPIFTIRNVRKTLRQRDRLQSSDQVR